MLGHKTLKFERTKITPSMFSNYSGIQLESNKRIKISKVTWGEINTLK